MTFINAVVSDFVLWRKILTLTGQTKSFQMQHISYIYMTEKENSNHNLSCFIFVFTQNDDLGLFPSKGPHKTARVYFNWSIQQAPVVFFFSLLSFSSSISQHIAYSFLLFERKPGAHFNVPSLKNIFCFFFL